MFSVFWQFLKYMIIGADFSIIEDEEEQQHELWPSTSTFDILPYDVMGRIFGNLPIGDRVRMRLVCKSWRDRLVRPDFPVKPEPPWIILPIDSFSQPEHLSTEISFESMFEERIYRFELPVYSSDGGPRYQWCCCGSSFDRGSWLLMAGRKSGEDLSSTKMILWDPISGTTKGLPALSTLPFFGELVEDYEDLGLENISTSEVIARAQVFSVGSCVVVAVVFVANDGGVKQHRLALCSPEEQSWSIVPDEDDEIFYKDILFHNGKLYTVSTFFEKLLDTSNATGSKWSGPVASRRTDSMVQLSFCDVEVVVLDLVYEHGDYGHLTLPNIGRRKLEERCHVFEHLVGSSNGELLVVNAILDRFSYNGGGQEPDLSHSFSQTGGFEVYGLDVNANNCLLERLTNVGNQSLFVGATGSTSVEGVDLGNIIHFATNDSEGERWLQEEEWRKLDQFLVVHEQGVFDMTWDTFEGTKSTNFSKQSGSCSGWFTPKLPT